MCYFLGMSKDIYEEIVALRSKGIPAALATIIRRKGATPRKDSAKMLIYADGNQLGTIGGGSIDADVCREARMIMESGIPKVMAVNLKAANFEERTVICGGIMEVYIEPIHPDPTLFIFGAGHVSKALAAAVKLIGFKVAIIDDQTQYANPERFPGADAFYIDSWTESLKKISANQSSYFFIATRSHEFDLICLRFAVQSQAEYIGMLGSMEKAGALFEILEKEGINPSEFERVFVPAGFDIGSESPEEIAASIAAEMIAARKNLEIRVLKDAVNRARHQGTSAS
jgi:xanthine dehydrogenase accessory factor